MASTRRGQEAAPPEGSLPREHFEADEIRYQKGAPPHGSLGAGEAPSKAVALEGTSHGITLPPAEEVSVGAPGCQKCEVLPQPLRGPGIVHLRFPHTHSLGKVMMLLADTHWKHQEREGTLSIHAHDGSLAPLLSPIMEVLSQPEQRDTRALFQPEGQMLQAADYFEIESLPDFVERSRSAWLLDILREKRLFSIFQPIIARSTRSNGLHNGSPNGDGRHVFGYECLMRAHVDGGMVSAGTMMDMARAAGLTFQLDLAARRAAITGAAEHGIREKLFINFAPNSIYDPNSCLESTVRLIDELGLRHDQVVFEVIESERLPPAKHLQRIVGYYRERGFGVALDDVGSGFSSLHTLMDLRPDYVKLDMSLTRGVHQDKAKAIVARKLIETVQELELKTIAEGIETEAERDWVEEHGTDFLQGYLFARPATPPPMF